MSQSIADRYARALFELTESESQSSDVKKDFDQLLVLQAESEEFQRLTTDPVIPVDVKIQALDSCLGSKIHKQTLNYLQFLAQKKRLDLLTTIGEAFNEMYLSSRDQLPALIQSKVELSKTQIDKITKRFHALTGKTILPQFEVNSEMLGGFRVKVRDRIYDHSIECKLENYRRAILNQ